MLNRIFAPGLFLVLGVVTLTFAVVWQNPGEVQAQEPGPEGGVQATIQRIVQAFNSGDLTTLVSLTTDKGFEELIEVSKSEALAAPEEVFGDQVVLQDIRSISVQGTTATAVIDLEFGLGVLSQETSFVFQGGRWILDGVQPASGAVPSGATLVDVDLQEFAFVYDDAALNDGNVAFNVQNVGQQEHEILLAKVDPALSTSDLLDLLSEEGEPPFEDFGFLGIYEPGQSDTVALAHPLEPGTYAFLCFLPDTDGVPHAFKGMISEFTVGGVAAGPGPITPPSTGDGGLADGDPVNLGLVVLGAALLLLGAASTLRAVRS